MYESILRQPDVVTVDNCPAVKNACLAGRFCARGITVETQLQEGFLAVYVTAPETPVSRVRLRWHFTQPLRGKVLGDAWERAYADLAWENITPYHTYPWYVLVNREQCTAGYGVMVRPGAICGWMADPEGVTLNLDVRCGGTGVRLGGRRLLAAKVVSEVYDGMNAFRAAQAFCRRMCTDPIFPQKPVYGANNWYYAYGRSSAEEVRAEARYLAKLTEGMENRPYLVIDDCWQKGRYHDDGSYEEIYNGGPWLPNEKFGDMKAVAESIRSEDVIPGIWVRLLQDDLSGLPEEWKLPGKGLDPSLPEVLDHIRGIVDQIGQWGFRLLKHDFSTFDIFGRWGCEMPVEMAVPGWYFHDQGRTSAEIIVSLYQAILEAAKPHGMLILGCNTIGHLGAGLMHINRTGDDTSGLMWERTLRFGVNTLAMRMPQHRTFFDADADCLGITERISWDYNRLWGRLLSLSGTSLFYSVKPGTMKAEEEEELREMLRENAAVRASAEPLDWQETALPQEWLLSGQTSQSSHEEIFHWYPPEGLLIGCANGPIWGEVWRELTSPEA